MSVYLYLYIHCCCCYCCWWSCRIASHWSRIDRAPPEHNRLQQQFIYASMQCSEINRQTVAAQQHTYSRRLRLSLYLYMARRQKKDPPRCASSRCNRCLHARPLSQTLQRKQKYLKKKKTKTNHFSRVKWHFSASKRRGKKTSASLLKDVLIRFKIDRRFLLCKPQNYAYSRPRGLKKKKTCGISRLDLWLGNMIVRSMSGDKVGCSFEGGRSNRIP